MFAEPGIILRERSDEGEVIWEDTTAQNLEVIKKVRNKESSTAESLLRDHSKADEKVVF